jgi:hypothetical protein
MLQLVFLWAVMPCSDATQRNSTRRHTQKTTWSHALPIILSFNWWHKYIFGEASPRNHPSPGEALAPFRNKLPFSRWGVVSPSPYPEAVGPILVGCWRLLTQYTGRFIYLFISVIQCFKRKCACTRMWKQSDVTYCICIFLSLCSKNNMVL